jgi:hypothetical protein
MKLDEFKNYVIAQREATRQENLKAILSVASATITDNNKRKEN